METSVKIAMPKTEVMPEVIAAMSFPLEILYAGQTSWVVPFDRRLKVRPFHRSDLQIIEKCSSLTKLKLSATC